MQDLGGLGLLRCDPCGVGPARPAHTAVRASAPASGMSSLSRIIGRCGARCPRRTRVPLRHLSRVSCTRSSISRARGRHPTRIADVSEAVRKRFAETAPRSLRSRTAGRPRREQRLAQLLDLSGDERALDVGTGAGALALGAGPARPGRDRRRHRPRAARGGARSALRSTSSSRTATRTSCPSRRMPSTSSRRRGRSTTCSGRSSCLPR